jgi:hypothetical protein
LRFYNMQGKLEIEWLFELAEELIGVNSRSSSVYVMGVCRNGNQNSIHKGHVFLMKQAAASCIHHHHTNIPRLHKAKAALRKRLDKLLERTVKRRAERLDVLVELNGGLSTLGNALGSELEFLQS